MLSTKQADFEEFYLYEAKSHLLTLALKDCSAKENITLVSDGLLVETKLSHGIVNESRFMH
ncbi:hypothetical protein AVDCRST_MAG81-1693 [uncultured Synechococcales cyanobacterium]|uniref:Uncharacterized protein n=1 Tax=uncultured Synechococcales cyanobacterium TaxID=1936017 RepID=A0A6J4VAA5_9CYAN|nr:hypothetical protein AVDCRST_MAG81-1693 [uncultured Synechococcales cyanobacterium]